MRMLYKELRKRVPSFVYVLYVHAVCSSAAVR